MANLNAILTFLNSEAIQKDASVAFTQIPTLPASNPTLANQAVRKQYVDDFLPASMIVDFGGSVAPAGWVFCDGATYDGTNALYSRLYAAIGNTYGGTGSSFVVPDLRGRVTVGKAASGTFAALNASGGAETHTLSAAESGAPAHGHGVTDPGHYHTQYKIAANGPASAQIRADYDTDTSTANVLPQAITSTDLTGVTVNNAAAVAASAAHNNLQPYRVVNKIIKL
jgi:microcystin-dependent protein